MLLVIDVGNTNIVLGVYDKAELVGHWRISTDRVRTTDEYGMLMMNLFFHDRKVDVKDIKDIIISSVVPPMMPTLERVCLRYFNVNPLIVGPGTKTGIAIKYDNPREVGADRIVNAVAANAQSVGSISNSKFFDNWQVGVNVGGYTPTTGYPFFKSTRLSFGAEVGKQISPSFRLSADGVAYINDNVDGYRNPLFIEHTNVAMLGNFNLSNIFAGYKGAPRTFEVEVFAGPGWSHSYYPGRNDSNEMTVKAGANFLLNLGASKAWAIKLSPSILYGLTPADQQAHSLNNNNSITQASLGIVYRFKGSNGAHHIALRICASA